MKQTITMTEHLIKQKNHLKELRAQLDTVRSPIDDEYLEEIVETLETMIGRINCYLTDDDDELERLAFQDGLRG